MSYVIQTDGTIKEVTNPGWLLRNSWHPTPYTRNIDRFDIVMNTPRIYVNGELIDNPAWADGFVAGDPERKQHYKTLMIAYMRDGRTFVTPWTDHTVMADWLDRPNYRGIPVRWFGIHTVIERNWDTAPVGDPKRG